MIIAEPVQNAGGCLVPPAGYWAGLRAIADRHGILLVADEVICAFGRIGEWFSVDRFGAVPDLITTAKGLTSAYAPMGAVLVSDRVAAPLYEERATLLHGITFGGHPVACAVALQNLELFERLAVLENVRAREAQVRAGLEAIAADVPLVGDVRGAGFFWALELVPDGDGGRFDADGREALVRGFLPRRLHEAGLIARPDDRGEPVLHLPRRSSAATPSSTRCSAPRGPCWPTPRRGSSPAERRASRRSPTRPATAGGQPSRENGRCRAAPRSSRTSTRMAAVRSGSAAPAAGVTGAGVAAGATASGAGGAGRGVAAGASGSGSAGPSVAAGAPSSEPRAARRRSSRARRRPASRARGPAPPPAARARRRRSGPTGRGG